jgi:hypothetical protein
VPEERLRPLTVLGYKNKRLQYIGALETLIKGEPTFDWVKNRSRMADIAGRQSRSVSSALGLQILQGFLQGFGVPAAGITSKFTGAARVSFAFQDVVRFYIDPSVIGTGLKKRVVDQLHPTAAPFFAPGATQMLLVDSVITSKDFTISIDQNAQTQFDLDLEGIEQIVSGANTGVKVSSSGGRDITFQGKHGLAFAFSCLRVDLNLDGSIASLAQDISGKVLSGDGSLPRAMLTEEPGMFDLE